MIVARPVVLPAVTRPVEETDAVEAADVVHVTSSVRFCVLPSVYSPVAVSCWVSPDGRFAAGGDTTTARRSAGRTVIAASPPSTELEGSVAVIVASPVLSPAVTRPDEETEAVEAAEVDHVTSWVRLTVVPSE